MACGAMRRWSSGAGFAAASRDTRRFWARGRVLWTVRWGRRSGSSGEATCHRFPVGWREGDLDVPVCLLESHGGYRRVSRTGEEALLPDPGKQWPAPRTLSLWSSWRHLWLPSWPGLAADRSPRDCGCQQTVGFTLKHPPLWNSCAMCRTDMTQYLLTSTEPFALSSMLAVREDVNSINHSSVRKIRSPFLIPAGEKCVSQQLREDGLNKTLHYALVS